MSGGSTGLDAQAAGDASSGGRYSTNVDMSDDGERVAASLTRSLERLIFVDLTTDEVTSRIIDATAAWGRGEGWRVYLRAPSVVTLPPPRSREHSVLDVACARPVGAPVVIEIDHTDRQRTLDKLAAEAAAGRIAIWVRWGARRSVTPAPPIHLVTCDVTYRTGLSGRGRLFARSASTDRPPPAHSGDHVGGASSVALPLTEHE